MKAIKVLKDTDLYSEVITTENNEQYRLINYFFYYSLEEINQQEFSDDYIVGFAFFENVSDKTIHSCALWYQNDGDTYTSLADITLSMTLPDDSSESPDLLNIIYSNDKVVGSNATEWEFIELVLNEEHSVLIWQSGILKGENHEHLQFKQPALYPYTAAYIDSVEILNGKVLNAQVICYDHMRGDSTVIRCPIIVDGKSKNFVITIVLESATVIVNMTNLVKNDKCLIKDVCSYLESKETKGPFGTLLIVGDDHDGFYKAHVSCFDDEVQDILKRYSGIIEYDFTIKEEAI